MLIPFCNIRIFVLAELSMPLEKSMRMTIQVIQIVGLFSPFYGAVSHCLNLYLTPCTPATPLSVFIPECSAGTLTSKMSLESTLLAGSVSLTMFWLFVGVFSLYDFRSFQVASVQGGFLVHYLKCYTAFANSENPQPIMTSKMLYSYKQLGILSRYLN